MNSHGEVLQDILKAAEPDFLLYHGTSEPADKIRAEGLKGEHSQNNAVYLTDNPQLAQEYAESDQERTGNDWIVIVSVKVADLDPALLYGDIDHASGNNIEDWQESLRETDQCMYRGDIPPGILIVEEF